MFKRNSPPNYQIDQIAASWLQALAAQSVPIELKHVGKLYRMAPLHRDPFDRILLAQALTEGFTIVTPDVAFLSYGVPILW